MDDRTRTRTGGQSEKASKTRNIRTMPVNKQGSEGYTKHTLDKGVCRQRAEGYESVVREREHDSGGGRILLTANTRKF